MEEIVACLAALDILLEGTYLNEDHLIDPAYRLDEKKIAWLQNYKDFLKKRIQSLPFEDNPDTGYTLLVCLARYLVIEKSIHEKKLYLLDTFPDDTRIVQNNNKSLYEGISLFLQDEWNKTMSEEHEATELSYRKIEDLASRLIAFKNEQDIRISFRTLYPRKTGMYRLPEFKESTESYIALAKQMEKTATQYEQKLKEVYSYGLIRKNCTTELLRVIQESNEGSQAEFVDPYSGLNFIPYVSMLSVQKKWKNVKSSVIPSYRLQKLKSLNAKEKSLKTFFRESFAPSSTFYQYSDDDEWFIFFTDDNVPARPIFGTVNLITGMAQTFSGLLSLPFDNGKTIKKGLKGMLFSLPELIFWNFRKGSFDPFTRSKDGVPPYQLFQLQPLSLEAL